MDNIKKINEINKIHDKVNIMEVCGTHTMAISKFGLRDVLSHNINLISGPGCPVCVTPDVYIDYIYNLALEKDIIIATYGDMIRVPGSNPHYTLEYAKALGAKVKMVYSSMDALKLAQENPDRKIVFMGIGFETTAPATAIAVKEAESRDIDNFYVLSVHKQVEPVMKLLLEDKELNINGFLCPGHVAAIIGVQGFNFLKEYKCAGVVAGFELDEILDALDILIRNIENKEYTVMNKYEKLVKHEGNAVAMNIINDVFQSKDDLWRGMGLIRNSGLKLNERYKKFDIERLYPVNYENSCKKNGCSCGEVLKGKIKPKSCALFGKVCTPENPVGPCMVSVEGSCAAFYKYNRI